MLSFLSPSNLSHNFCRTNVLLFNASVTLFISSLCASFSFSVYQNIAPHITIGKPSVEIAVVTALTSIALITCLSYLIITYSRVFVNNRRYAY
nr:MAG TPA: hypothetical protein [Caudoviricetes sp.]